MFGLLILPFLILNFLAVLIYPWIGTITTYLVGILTPQNIWWWHFIGKRPYFWMTVCLLTGFLLGVPRKCVSTAFLKTPIAITLIIYWFTFLISYLFGPFVHIVNEYRFFDASTVFSNLSKTILVAVISISLLNDDDKVKWFSSVILLCAIYFIYWANLQYLTGRVMGRLHGPTGIGISIYNDENIFAMMFVVGIPFLYYAGKYFESKILRVCLWLIIPFGWHAIFLTASRGGLLGLGISTFVISLRENKKAVKFLLIPALVLALGWQGGSIMKHRAETISKYEQDRSAEERLEAWKAAVKMGIAHPITGVGIASMGQAYPYFSNYPYVRIAHNTFFQLFAENGAVCGLSYIFLIFFSIKNLWSSDAIRKICTNTNDHRFIFLLNEATLAGLIGFFICSIFLSLHEYEVFYYLLIITNFLYIRKSGHREDVH